MEEYAKSKSIEHEELFPKATLETQMLKLEEELTECVTAEDMQSLEKELGDCVLVCCGIYRFAPKVALLILCELENTAEYFGIDLKRAADKKWEVNKKRTWNIENGIYHHEGADEYD